MIEAARRIGAIRDIRYQTVLSVRIMEGLGHYLRAGKSRRSMKDGEEREKVSSARPNR